MLTTRLHWWRNYDNGRRGSRRDGWWILGTAHLQTPGRYFDGMSGEPQPVRDITGATVLAVLGDSVTTDHISPAGAIEVEGPAGDYLSAHGVARSDFNSYGSRRGNHEVMIRGTFAISGAAISWLPAPRAG